MVDLTRLLSPAPLPQAGEGRKNERVKNTGPDLFGNGEADAP